MIYSSRNRYEDIRRTVVLSSALRCLDQKTYLFREAYALGYPKFTDVREIAPGLPMTAFVGLDRNDNFLFCWGRAFFDRLVDDQQWLDGRTGLDRVMFILAHETLHVVFRHVTRGREKVSKVWNYAADIVVNWYCDWYGLYVLPGSVTVEDFPEDWNIDPENQTTDEIYEILLKQAEVLPLFMPVAGHHDQWAQYDGPTVDILDSKITDAQSKAAARDEEEGNNDPASDGQGCGKLPGDGAAGELREFADKIVADNRVPWDRMLKHRLGSLYEPTVSERWDRLPTRLSSQWGSLILPSQRPDRKPTGVHVLAALDASASMSEDDVYRMSCLLASLPDNYKATIVSFDTECYIIESLDKIRGGGGTSLEDVNRVAEELEVDVVVCLTDGYFGRSDKIVTRPADWVFVIDGTDEYVPDGATRFLV